MPARISPRAYAHGRAGCPARRCVLSFLSPLGFAIALMLSGCARPVDADLLPPAPQVDPGATIVPAVHSAADAKPAFELASAPGPGASIGKRCPSEMVLVDGLYCTDPKQECVEWLDDPVKYPFARCARFSEQITCQGERVAMTFCIDKHEYTQKGQRIPMGDVSWTEAKQLCEADGKRLCGESEWTFACEGERSVPYPYGYERDASRCNFEKQSLIEKGKLRDLRESVDASPLCLSPFGVHGMVGNVDEWVVLDKPHYAARNNNRRMMSGLKGGWWGPLRNRCRPVTVDHDEHFHELQTGFRCCAEPSGKVALNSAQP